MTPTEGTTSHDVLTIARLARFVERACTDLTLAQYRILALVADGEERASDLAGRLALAKPTVSATLDALVDRGLVARAVVEDDRRATRLAITPTGQQILRSTEAAMSTRLDALLASSDDAAALGDALARVRVALDTRRAARRERGAGGRERDPQ